MIYVPVKNKANQLKKRGRRKQVFRDTSLMRKYLPKDTI